jgi:DNA-binding XRE family transcriptional regulator
MTDYYYQNTATFRKFYHDLADQLTEIRKLSGQTHEDVAKILQVDKRYIAAIENKKKFPLIIVLRYADLFSIDIKITFKVN